MSMTEDAIRADEREKIARAIEGTPWEAASRRGPGTSDPARQRDWSDGADAGVEFAARIARNGAGR